MNVLFIIQNYSTYDGSSLVLYEYIKNNPLIQSYKIICRKILSKQEDLVIEEVSNKNKLKKVLNEKNYDLVHYFKTLGYELFNWAFTNNNKNLPIITTVCQRPSKIGMLLSPNEIKYSRHIIFIDKSSYQDPLYYFIPKDIKSVIYFGRNEENIKTTQRIIEEYTPDNDTIIFGRGSSLNKCPLDLIDIFDQIQIKNKKLIIAGINKGSWIEKKYWNREDIIIYPPSDYISWLKLCNTFDIFLYYLPLDTHSSIDGTLGDAMILEKPCIYYGPGAPKERFTNGEDGFICETKDDLIKWANILGKDQELRKNIGKNARKSIIRNFPLKKTIDSYNQLYSRVIKDNEISTHHIPLSFILYFYRHSIRQFLRYVISGTTLERKFSVYK